MNNLTPLQEVASRIYAAKIASGVLAIKTTYQGADTGNREFSYNHKDLLAECIIEAKALIQAAKFDPSEPLSWEKKIVDGYSHPAYYSNGDEIEISETNGREFSIAKNDVLKRGLNIFPTLDEAKAFAEHIRTR
jgi:hypothetical protein